MRVAVIVEKVKGTPGYGLSCPRCGKRLVHPVTGERIFWEDTLPAGGIVDCEICRTEVRFPKRVIRELAVW